MLRFPVGSCQLTEYTELGRLEYFKRLLEGEAFVEVRDLVVPEDGRTRQPATNLSGFNGIPVGMYVGAFQTDYENKHLAYWTLDNTNATIDTKVFYMKSDTNIIEESNAGIDTKAFAIRCIRKVNQ